MKLKNLWVEFVILGVVLYIKIPYYHLQWRHGTALVKILWVSDFWQQVSRQQHHVYASTINRIMEEKEKVVK